MNAKTGIPIGYIITVLTLAYCTWVALFPRRFQRGFPTLSLYFGPVINELPFLAFIWLFLSTLLAFKEGDVYSLIGWITFGCAVLTALGLTVIIWRSSRAFQKILQALNEGLGASWLNKIDVKLADRLNSRFRFLAVLGPFFRRRWNVKHIPNINYGDAGKSNLLNIYLLRSRSVNAPVLIHFHGGAMTTGKKNREALPLLYHLASKGWMCISANYRLQPAARFPLNLSMLKR